MSRFHTIVLANAVLLGLIPVGESLAVDFTWTGGSTPNVNWATDGNWDVAGFPDINDVAIFAGTAAGFDMPIYQGMTTSVDAPDVVFQTAGWTILAGNRTMDFAFEGGGNTDSGITSAGAGVNRISAPINWDSRNEVNVAAGNTLVFDGTLRLARALEKSGDGTLILNSTANPGGASIAKSPINVTGGTALVNYDVAAITSPRFSANGGTLGGHGSLNIGAIPDNDVQIRIGQDVAATLAPGGDGTADGGSKIGTLNVNYESTGSGNSVIIYGGSALAIDLGAADGVSDLLDITISGGATDGYLSLAGDGQTLALFSDDPLAPGNSYTIATFANSEAVDYGVFETVTYNGASADGLFDVIYNENSIAVSVIPEPASMILMIAGVGLIASHRRSLTGC